MYDYAREGMELPAPPTPRKLTVHSLELLDFYPDNHTFPIPKEEATEGEKAFAKYAEKQFYQYNPPELATPETATPACRLRLKVSTGFYVRSFCHDLGVALGSSGYMAELMRTRQGNNFGMEDAVPWEEFVKGGPWEEKVVRILREQQAKGDTMKREVREAEEEDLDQEMHEDEVNEDETEVHKGKEVS
jgi:tRNA pseudouridine55 synthase